MPPHATIPGTDTQTDLLPRLLLVCRTLTDHLTAYAISAANFDDEAFTACEQAEALLFDARRLPWPKTPEQPALLD